MAHLPVVYGPEYLSYNFGPGHPFTPARWEALRHLVTEISVPLDWITPESSTDEDILNVHSDDFVSAVKAASDALTFLHPGFFGLGTGDVPTFLGMHEASAWVVGGTLAAGKLVGDGTGRRALQLGGGLHHAMRDRASGFCVYNDPAILIERFVGRGMRVAYIDIDVHHGDGVQAIFYNNPDVLTISMHESGQYLFPGTGFVEETGGPNARGTSINIPVHPGTTDESYLEAFDDIVPDCVQRFGPDVLVLEVGADSHALDPLAHISLTVSGYEQLFDRVMTLAEESTGGRLVSVLGGGYAFDSTIRIWASLACKLAGSSIPEQLPEIWIDRWQHRLLHPEWVSWHDEPLYDDPGSALHARDRNRETVRELNAALNYSK